MAKRKITTGNIRRRTVLLSKEVDEFWCKWCAERDVPVSTFYRELISGVIPDVEKCKVCQEFEASISEQSKK